LRVTELPTMLISQGHLLGWRIGAGLLVGVRLALLFGIVID
jgi:hypothetical protein